MTAITSLPLDRITESPLNPRKTFDAATITQLAESLTSHGQLTPVIVRPAKGNRYELAAGHRRFRAAQQAGLAALDAIVRPMDDTALLEVLTIENLQREDVHPLEEAAGFAALLKQAKGYDVAKIAARIGKSTRYVYDRLHLLQLIPEAQAYYRAGHLTLGHAVLLARQTREVQAELVVSQDDSIAWLFENPMFSDGDLFGEGDDESPDVAAHLDAGRLVARSVRDLEGWIREHVRLDLASAETAELFPETVKAVQRHRSRVVEISDSWRYGTMPAEIKARNEWVAIELESCEHEQIGVYVLGQKQGQTVPVCCVPECIVHGADARATVDDDDQDEYDDDGEDEDEDGQPRAKSEWELWREKLADVGPQMQDAIMQHVLAMPLAPTDTRCAALVGKLTRLPDIDAPTTFEGLVRLWIANAVMPWDGAPREVWEEAAKDIGLDLSPFLDGTPAKPAKAPRTRKGA